MSTPSRLALLEESPSSPHDRVSPAFKTIEDPGTQSSPALLDESPSSPQDRVSQAFKTPSGPAPQNSIWTRPNNEVVVLPSDNEELNALQNELSKKCILTKRKPKCEAPIMFSTDDEGDEAKSNPNMLFSTDKECILTKRKPKCNGDEAKSNPNTSFSTDDEGDEGDKEYVMSASGSEAGSDTGSDSETDSKQNKRKKKKKRSTGCGVKPKKLKIAVSSLLNLKHCSKSEMKTSIAGAIDALEEEIRTNTGTNRKRKLPGSQSDEEDEELDEKIKKKI